jgi:NADH-quinone oxidoreductase subunit K
VSGALVLAAVAPRHVLWLSAALFAVGLAGVACRRNLLIVLLSIEIQLNAANLALVAFSKVHGDVSGQTLVFFAMTVAAAEVAVGLAILIALFRIRRDADADAASDLREKDLGPVPPLVPEGVPDPHAHDDADDGAEGPGHGPESRPESEEAAKEGHGRRAEPAHATHGSGA